MCFPPPQARFFGKFGFQKSAITFLSPSLLKTLHFCIAAPHFSANDLPEIVYADRD